MSANDLDKRFSGSIPRLYQSHLVPLIFEPYAHDIVERVAARAPSNVLEIAAGTGVVTRRLAARLPASVPITASDLNPAMLEEAARMGTPRPVEWRQADAMRLPFDDASFDAVVCQFGVMFLPDRGAGFAEMRRVLRPEGVLLFNTWDDIASNEFADVVTEVLAGIFPDDPPRFMARTPHGYFERDLIARDLERGGFDAPARFDTVSARSVAPSADVVAVAYCQGTPLRSEIEARDASRLEEATQASTRALAGRFGPGPVDGLIRAIVVEARR